MFGSKQAQSEMTESSKPNRKHEIILPKHTMLRTPPSNLFVWSMESMDLIRALLSIFLRTNYYQQTR